MPSHFEPEQLLQYNVQLNQAILNEDRPAVLALLEDELNPYDIAHIIESSPGKQRLAIWQYLNSDLQTDVLANLTDDIQIDFLARMSTQEIIETTADLDSDDLADVLQQLPSVVSHQVLQSMAPSERVEVEGLLAYHEDSAGGLMDTDIITVRANVSMDVVIRFLRRQRSLPDTFDAVFVINRNNQFVGMLSLTKILISNPNVTVREIMNSDVEGISANMPNNEVAQLFERHDFVTAPVVDQEGLLLGRITIDDIVDVIREEGDHRTMGLAGLDEDQDIFSPVLKSFKGRAIWLGINLITAFVAASVILKFEDAIAILPALAFVSPIIASMGGVAGSQTLTLVIRAQAMGQINPGNFRWLLSRELSIGFLNGLLWAIITGSGVYLLKSDLQLSIVSALAILINVVIAKATGALLPRILKRLNIDPALSGSVILTTVTDAVGFSTLLGLATWYLI